MLMEHIEQIFSDNEGNHLLVALYFCDDEYKLESLHIPEEYSQIKIIDINISKAYDRPIHFSVFRRMSSWLLKEFERREDSIFTFICSTDHLNTNHPEILPQEFRWALFDKLYLRHASTRVNVQDVIVGPEGYQSLGRAFYHPQHAPIIHVTVSYLQEKQRLYN